MPLKKEHLTGSPHDSEPVYLMLGKLRRAHGIKGEIPLEVYSDMLELLSPDQVVYVGETHQALTIEATRWKNELLLLKFKNLDDREIVSKLTNDYVYVKTDQLPSLDEEEFYYHQLLGLRVFEEDGKLIGQLSEILQTGANDVYLIKSDQGEEVLIPAIEDVILEIDLAQQKMIVATLEWYGGKD